jgi:DNA invertase Pin-like site-specific DNA recombinase
MSTRVAASSPTERMQTGQAAPSGPSSARREGHLIGYARVSTTGQDTATQEARLQAAGCTLIRTETVSGGSRNGRNELASILDFIRPGDVLIVVKLDRLGRNTRDVLNLVHELEEKGASLRVLEPAIDTGGPMGRMVLTVLGMVAEMELGFIRDRQRAGIDAAKAKGVYKGRYVFPPYWRKTMTIYIALFNLTDAGIKAAKESSRRLDAAKKLLADMGGEMKQFYMVMGEFDFVGICEAPDDAVMARYALQLGGLGFVRTKTLKAFPETAYREIIRSLG